MIVNFRIIDAAPVDELCLVCLLWRKFLEDYTGQYRERQSGESAIIMKPMFYVK
jgi:hypothetical protein